MKDSFSSKKVYIIKLASIALSLVLWKLLSLKIGTDIILPPPEAVLLRLPYVFVSKTFLQAVLFTSLRFMYALIISFLLGFTIGIACGINKVIDSIMSPIISVIRSTPVMSVILLAMIWFKTDNVPIFVCVLMVLPIITANVKQGVRGVDPKLLDLAQIYKLERKDIIRHIIIPSVFPFVMAGLNSSIGIAWKVVIAAEVLAQPIKAIGTNLQFSQMNLETTEVIAWTIIAVLLSSFSEGFLNLILKNRKWELKKNGE